MIVTLGNRLRLFWTHRLNAPLSAGYAKPTRSTLEAPLASPLRAIPRSVGPRKNAGRDDATPSRRRAWTVSLLRSEVRDRGTTGGYSRAPSLRPNLPEASDILRAPRTLTRLAIALGISALSVAYFAHVQRLTPGFRSDLDLQLAGARYLIEGKNPYPLIGPGRAFEWFTTLYHPVPTLLVLAPLSALPMPIARLIFVGVTSFLFAFALASFGGTRWRYVAIISKCYQATLLMAQWSFVLAAAWVFPVVASIALVKPNVGAAVLAARASKRALILAAVVMAALTIASFLVFPGWLSAWRSALATDPNRAAAVQRSGGFLLLLAGLKWRRPEARLLFTLSVVPQTLGMYDALLLFMIPKRASEFIALAVLSHFAFLMTFHDASIHRLNDYVVASGIATVHWLYLPALAMVLIRPNVYADSEARSS